MVLSVMLADKAWLEPSNTVGSNTNIHALEDGRIAVLTKPFRSVVLRLVVRRCIESKTHPPLALSSCAVQSQRLIHPSASLKYSGDDRGQTSFFLVCVS